jgi:DNA-binding transcriptional MocR family regulator
MIDAGSLRPGDRVPSVRQLSSRHGVSVPTVQQAYLLLESRLLIEARPRSGFYVRPRLAVKLTAPALPRCRPAVVGLERFDRLLSLTHQMLATELVPLGAAIPSPDLLPVEKLSRLSASIARAQASACVSYDPAPGSLRLRQELARRSLDWGCGLQPDEFVVTTGASEALHLALRAVTGPGDTVLVESPAYYGVLNSLAQLGLRVVPVPACSNEGMDIDAVAAALKRHHPAAIVLSPNFSNPSGSLMPEPARRALVALAAAVGTPIIEDDIYGDLPHGGERPRSLKALDKTGDVILCSSFSKTLAPGLRVGFVAGGRHHDKIVRLKTALNFGCATLPVLTVAEFLRNGGYDRHLRRLRHTYRDQVCKVREAVAALFPPGTRVSNPSGGFVLWLELPGQTDAIELFRAALAAGVSVAPGPLFSPDGGFARCLRLSCGFPWGPRIEAGLGTLARLMGGKR